MQSFKEWLKQFLALLICAITVLSPFNTVYASDYVKSDDDDGIEYYIVEGEDVDKLFDFSVGDIGDIVPWMLTFKTYTVIKHDVDDNGDDEYTCYFNTPNLQSIVKNEIISNINDGYTDDAYDVNETQWLVSVGKKSDNVNAITKYGFNIANYTYMGEYPKETMTVAGVLPQSWIGGIWRSIKSFFTGASFLETPDADNFNTISYYNHTYKDNSDLILQIFKKYYVKDFVAKIADDGYDAEYFNDPDEILNQVVSEDAYNKAVEYIEQHGSDYQRIADTSDAYTQWQNAAGEEVTDPILNETFSGNGFASSSWISGYGLVKDSNGNDVWISDTVIKNSSSYDNAFYTWAKNNKELVASIYADATGNTVDPTTWELPGETGENPDDKVEFIYTISEGIKNATVEVDDDGNVTGISYSDGEIYDISAYESYLNQKLDYTIYDGFLEDDFLTEEDHGIKVEYEKALATKEQYENFVETLSIGEKYDWADALKGDFQIFYNQCLIENQGKDKECWSKKYGDDKTSIAVIDLYVYSGIYKYTEGYVDAGKYELTDQEASQIIKKMQSYCGPYYSEVLSSMLILMTYGNIADGDGSLLNLTTDSDPRVMPYDVESMTPADKDNYEIADPRCEIYKDTFIGNLMAHLTLNLGFWVFFKPFGTVLNIAGRITELSVFFQQICNFDKFEEWNLSPVTMWSSMWSTLLMGMLAVFFLVKTVISLLKMGTKAGVHVVLGFLVLFLELGVITAVVAAPEKSWNTIKSWVIKVSSLGEISTVGSIDHIKYLYEGADDTEITYYVPYLDIWSKYNTGYGLNKPEQLIDYETNKDSLPELKELEEEDIPTIGDNQVEHYSIMLADSFSYYGNTRSISRSINKNGEMYNGPFINNNAYRVVDHFMAPRVTVEKVDDDTLSLSVTANENYNGQFQSTKAAIDIITKFLNCILLCWISLIKMCTFFWQWWMLYILVFNIILGKLARHKTWKDIFLETFAPTIALIVIGMYAGLCIIIGLEVEGIIGLFLEIGLFAFTGFLVAWWSKFYNGKFFPGSLKWMSNLLGAFFMGKSHHKTSTKEEDKLTDKTIIEARDNGFDISEEDVRDSNKFTDKIYNDDGTRKSMGNKKTYDNWYERIKRDESKGKVLTYKQQLAKDNYEREMEERKNQIDKNNPKKSETNNTDKVTHKNNKQSNSSRDK